MSKCLSLSIDRINGTSNSSMLVSNARHSLEPGIVALLSVLHTLGLYWGSLQRTDALTACIKLLSITSNLALLTLAAVTHPASSQHALGRKEREGLRSAKVCT